MFPSPSSEKVPLLPTATETPAWQQRPRQPWPRAWAFAERCLQIFLVLFFVWVFFIFDATPRLPASVSFSPRATDLDHWIATQEERSFQGVLANIGSEGLYSGSGGAKAGVVIASPSTSKPDYLYTWTRDAALVSKALLERMIITGNSSLAKILREYSDAQSVLQHVSNPSGTFTTGGLGEPKFNVDYSAFTENWGRPQRDGPALRATTLMGYASYLLESGAAVDEGLVSMIDADLQYVATYYNNTGFDLWEEVRGSSFFTTAVQYRALVEGAAFFKAIGRPKPTFETTADSVLCFLQSYWSEGESFIISNINAAERRMGLDGNSLLASIHTFDPDDIMCSSATFQPCSDKALRNHKAVVDSFRSLYPVNHGIPEGSSVAVGRYSEDVYYGGQPWYLLTLAASEQLHDAIYTWKQAGEITITEVSLPFFSPLYSQAKAGTYSRDSATFDALLEAVRVYADGFFSIVQEFTPKDGSLAEQFDRKTGNPLSASDLTWSYASFVTAAAARRGEVPKGWNSAGSGAEVCSSTGSASAVLVTFDELVTTSHGENVFVVGSAPELGSWDADAARPLSAEAYTPTKNLWSRSLYLPPSSTFEYKFIRKQADGSIKWETGPNRSLTTSSAGETQTIDASWQ